MVSTSRSSPVPGEEVELVHDNTRTFGDRGQRIVRHRDGKSRLRREEFVEPLELGATARKHKSAIDQIGRKFRFATVERGPHGIHDQRNRILECIPDLL